MPLKVAIQMDPIGAVSITADSTFRIALEAQARGHALFYYTPDRLAYQEGRVTARGWPLSVRPVQGDHFALGPEEERDLQGEDVVWLRQDPPFDMAYITTTHLLEMIHPRTLVVNDPASVRNAPEKLLVLGFPDLTPPTAIARDLRTLRAFRDRHGDVILKPLYGNGGAGVFKLGTGDGNLASLVELFASFSREPLIVQKYLPAVRAGDKRVILVDGEPVGAINRVPAEGRDALQHARGRQARARGPHGARPRDLRSHRAYAQGARPPLRGHRRHRRLAHRDQRDLAHGHPGAGALRRGQRGGTHLGRDRAPAGLTGRASGARVAFARGRGFER
jgi:glutathione synthase